MDWMGILWRGGLIGRWDPAGVHAAGDYDWMARPSAGLNGPHPGGTALRFDDKMR